VFFFYLNYAGIANGLIDAPMTRVRELAVPPTGSRRSTPRLIAVAVVCAIVAAVFAFRVIAQPAHEYVIYVASEAADKLSVLRFDGTKFRTERALDVGLMPVDIDGPHGLAISPDGKHFFVSIAHGQPNGTLWKYSTATSEPVGRVTLGMFPATLQVSPSGEFVYVANFNLHGDPVPSSVSVVHADAMIEVARIPTCRMPHGSRFNPQGTRHYSACMMDDTIVEIDTATMRVARHFRLVKGEEGGTAGPPPVSAAAHQMAGHGADAATKAAATCSPTWVQPSAHGSAVFVACNGTNEIVEIGVDAWTIRRRLAARNGVYNLATTRDGRLLVATNRRDQSVSIIELDSGRERVRIATPRRAVHGVAISADDRYAFVSSEGIGAESGSVIAIELKTSSVVARAEVAPQAGGIDVR
jgi:DNA-binding beta-propeller fold protein YncE